MINWSKIISDYNLSGTYGHFLIYAFNKPVDVVFWHYDKFDYQIYCPSLDDTSDLSTLEVVSINIHKKFDNFWGCIILDNPNFLDRLSRFISNH